MQLESCSSAASAALGLEHRLFLPEDSQAPLAILVHGRAGSYQSMSPFGNAFPQPCALLLPQAPLSDALGGFSWWPVDGTKPPSIGVVQEQAAQAAQSVERFVKQALTFYGLAPSALVALGFSQGAALLSVVLQRGLLPLRAVGLLAGFVLEQPQPRWPAELRSIFMAHGTQDEVISLAQAERGRNYLKRALEGSGTAVQVEMVVDAVGHKVGSQGMRALRQWGQAVLAG